MIVLPLFEQCYKFQFTKKKFRPFPRQAIPPTSNEPRFYPFPWSHRCTRPRRGAFLLVLTPLHITQYPPPTYGPLPIRDSAQGRENIVRPIWNRSHFWGQKYPPPPYIKISPRKYLPVRGSMWWGDFPLGFLGMSRIFYFLKITLDTCQVKESLKFCVFFHIFFQPWCQFKAAVGARARARLFVITGGFIFASAANPAAISLPKWVHPRKVRDDRGSTTGKCNCTDACLAWGVVPTGRLIVVNQNRGGSTIGYYQKWASASLRKKGCLGPR